MDCKDCQEKDATIRALIMENAELLDANPVAYGRINLAAGVDIDKMPTTDITIGDVLRCANALVLHDKRISEWSHGTVGGE